MVLWSLKINIFNRALKIAVQLFFLRGKEFNLQRESCTLAPVSDSLSISGSASALPSELGAAGFSLSFSCEDF